MELVSQVQTLIEKIRDSYIAAHCSYEVITESDGDDKYGLSLGFLNNASMYVIAAKTYYESHGEIERHDFEAYFEAFSNFKYELCEAIKDKDKNLTWLSSRKDSLDYAKRNVEGLLELLK